MHDYKPVLVAVAKSVAEAHEKDIVVIMALDRENERLDATTVGREPADKDIAAKWGELFAQATGADVSQSTWYEDFRATKEAEYKAKVDALERRLNAVLEALATFSVLRPAAEWHEDFGPVLWWHLPIQEPPEVGYGPGADECNADGTPTTCARLLEEGFLTHWSPLPDSVLLKTSDGEALHG
jgi:hypothetical protein